MSTFTILDSTYSSEKLNVLDQLAIVRRIVPIVTAVMKIRNAVRSPAELLNMENADLIFEALPHILDALVNMKDEDVEFVLTKCLLAVRRQSPNTAMFAPVWVLGARAPQFEDIDLPVMVQIAGTVIWENMGNFTQHLRLMLSGAGVTLGPASTS